MQTYRPYLIGLAGKAGVGKDTAAHMLEAPRYHYAFARPLKAMLTTIGIYEPIREKKEAVLPRFGFSYRQAAQTLGTEWGRALHPELWLLLAQIEWEERAKAYHSFMIITDVRFENEAQWVRENGTVVHIVGRETTVQGAAAGHASEAGLAVWPHDDYILHNDSTMEVLRARVEELGEWIRQRKEARK